MLMICDVTFSIEGQTKVAAAFTGNFDVYGPTLFKLCMHVAFLPLRPHQDILKNKKSIRVQLSDS